jgi:hypothetical protein
LHPWSTMGIGAVATITCSKFAMLWNHCSVARIYTQWFSMRDVSVFHWLVLNPTHSCVRVPAGCYYFCLCIFKDRHENPLNADVANPDCGISFKLHGPQRCSPSRDVKPVPL